MSTLKNPKHSKFWFMRSRTIRVAAAAPLLVAGLATLEASLPELKETLGNIGYVALSVGVSVAVAWARSQTTGPLGQHRGENSDV